MTDSELIYLVSSAGHPNYGDELIAASWLRYLADARPDARVWLDCNNPGRAAVMLAGIHPHLHVTDTFWRVAGQVHGDDHEKAHARARALTSRLGTPREDLGLMLAGTASSIHLLGGGYLTTRWPMNLLLLTIASQLHRDHRVPVHMTGAGLLPMDAADRRIVSEALGDLSHGDVRDAESAAAFGLPLGADDALLGLANGALRVDPRPSPDAMVLLQGDVHDAALMADAVDLSVQALREAGLGGTTLGIIESVPPDDTRHLDRIREAWGAATRLYSFSEIWTHGLPVRAGQTWITSRFHHHLLAAAHGARGIAVNTGLGYYRVKHASISRLGSGWGLAQVGEPWPAPSASADFPARARKAAADRVALAERIYPPQARARRRFGR
ncbi:polysaccharide pyruvyl transferase family protein [Demequina capsici]|uniref:Polysaccharide pyruvyl transferase family protein n=1 Tax=Demequina capsici TaxID=3075620 RepID=A0AA96JAN1_9MICO|nr:MULTISPECIES: polysaccharide pyruvyl transferase family protein [unclassified Demequina]WNM24356.1 polysaccharide pyruvyl transferase family protein [Demequina sp. OYTSA14]WNM27178.1 polysaccharide pyruvyl transferase family protein [Demequina sp. PMTSA13]